MTNTANQTLARPSAADAESAESRDSREAARVARFPPRGTESGHGAQAEVQPQQNRGERGPMKAILAVLILIAAVVAAWLIWREPSAPAAAAAAAVTAPLELAAVDVDTVTARVITRSLPLSGSLAPIVQATVKSKVGGEVEHMPLREGQDVGEGGLIARIDTRNLKAQYDRELAAVEKARADLQLAELNRDKNRLLLEQRYISQNTFESTESAYAGSVADLKLAEAQARLARISLDDAVIRAPFGGTIARRLVQPGEKVSPDSGVVSLVDLRQMVLEAAVPAADIPAVRIGQKARFTVGGFGERTFEGEVQRINPVATDGSRAIAIYIAVPNDDRALKGGMFAKGVLTLDATEPVLAVSQRAMREEAGVSFVYALREGKIERVPVTLGGGSGDATYVEVREGLAEGERVILGALPDLEPGRAAFVREAEASARSR